MHATPQRTATELLDALTVEDIEARLDDLDREAQALRVLLRAARARRRGQALRQQEVSHAG